MKAVLLVLNGHPASARERLRMLLPEAEIESLARAEVESSTYRKALQALRALRPDVFDFPMPVTRDDLGLRVAGLPG